MHRLDFTGLRARGAGFRLEAAGERSNPFVIGDDLYSMLSVDALRFFAVMRSGMPILDSVVPGYARPAGHVGRPPNRGDVAVPAWTGRDAERLYPGWRCAGTFDVSGGWYDAGDYGKYVTSGGIAVWQLLSTLDLLASVRPSESSGELATAIRDGWSGNASSRGVRRTRLPTGGTGDQTAASSTTSSCWLRLI